MSDDRESPLVVALMFGAILLTIAVVAAVMMR